MNKPLTAQQLASWAQGNTVISGNQMLHALERLTEDLRKLAGAGQSIRIIAEDLPPTPLEDELVSPEIVIPSLATGMLATIAACLLSAEEVGNILRSQVVSSAPDLRRELRYAEQIILVMLNIMTPEQKAVADETLTAAGISPGGMTRYHERRAALEKAGVE